MADSRMRRDSSDEIKVVRWGNKFLGISLWVVKTREEFWVFGKDVATALEYANPKEALQNHVTCEEDKRSLKSLLGDDFKAVLQRSFQGGSKNLPPSFFRNLQPNQILINELGIYSFCAKSRMPKAIPFQRWVYKTIKTIRETGSYTLPGGPVDNPLDLIAKVSSLEREVKTLRTGIRTCDKETQTEKSVIILDGSFKELEEKIVKALEKNKSSLKRAIKKVELDLEKSIQKVRLDIRRTSSSTSSSSPHRLYYSSDSN